MNIHYSISSFRKQTKPKDSLLHTHFTSSYSPSELQKPGSLLSCIGRTKVNGDVTTVCKKSLQFWWFCKTWDSSKPFLIHSCSILPLNSLQMQTLVSMYMQKANFLTPTFHYGKSIYKLATEIILIFHFPVSIVKNNKSRYFSMFNLYKIHNTCGIYITSSFWELNLVQDLGIYSTSGSERKWKNYSLHHHIKASLFLDNLLAYITFYYQWGDEGKCMYMYFIYSPQCCDSFFFQPVVEDNRGKITHLFLPCGILSSVRRYCSSQLPAVLFSDVLSLTKNCIILLLSYQVGKSGRLMKVTYFGLSKLEPATDCCK